MFDVKALHSATLRKLIFYEQDGQKKKWNAKGQRNMVVDMKAIDPQMNARYDRLTEVREKVDASKEPPHM